MNIPFGELIARVRNPFAKLHIYLSEIERTEKKANDIRAIISNLSAGGSMKEVITFYQSELSHTLSGIDHLKYEAKQVCKRCNQIKKMKEERMRVGEEEIVQTIQ